MNFEQLKYIIEVTERGSISKAAHHLFVTQPYISRVIKEVENQLGFALFVRTPQGITPTPSGKVFIQKAKVILEQYDSLMDIETQQRKDKTAFSITTVRSALVMETFLDLLKDFSNVDNYEFTFKETEGQSPIHDVTYHEADLGVIYTWDLVKDKLLTKLEKQNILYEKICSFNLCIILGVNHPLLKQKKAITLTDLEPYGLVAYEEKYLPYMLDYSHNYLDDLLDIKKAPKKIYVNSRAALHNLLSHRDFYSIGTQASKGQANMFNIVSIPLSNQDLKTDLEMGIVYKKNATVHPIAKKFIHKLKHTYSTP